MRALYMNIFVFRLIIEVGEFDVVGEVGKVSEVGVSREDGEVGEVHTHKHYIHVK